LAKFSRKPTREWGTEEREDRLSIGNLFFKKRNVSSKQFYSPGFWQILYDIAASGKEIWKGRRVMDGPNQFDFRDKEYPPGEGWI